MPASFSKSTWIYEKGADLLYSIQADKGKHPEMNGGIMNMIGGFTVLRFTGMLGMCNVTFTKEVLLKMNRQLNKISKPK